MREHLVDNSHTNQLDRERLHDEYKFGGGYALRWLLYEHTEDGLDFHEESRRRLDLQGNEDIIDIGCGMGSFLKSIEQDGHEGRLVGIDYTDSLKFALGHTSISLVQADASCVSSENGRGTGLPFADNSFDIASALFMLYHVGSPESTLREMMRIVKPGGRIVVATSGQSHKEQHRQFEAKIAEAMGVTKPARYTQNFTSEVADVLLPQLFDTVEVAFPHRTRIVIREEDLHPDPFSSGSSDVLSDYVISLKSMARHYGKDGHERKKAYSHMNEAIRKVVLSEICQQIKDSGEFAETVHRNLYVCRNSK